MSNGAPLAASDASISASTRRISSLASFESTFCRRPTSIVTRNFGLSGTMTPAASEVYVTTVLARMMHRVLVESWEAEKAVEEAHNKVVEIYARYAEG